MKNLYYLRSNRGSTLILVAIVTIVLALISGVLLRYASTEKRLNNRNVIRIEAQNAAEAAMEYSAAELATRFQGNRNFTTTTLLGAPLTTHGVRLPILFGAATGTPTTVDPASIIVHVSSVSTPTVGRIGTDGPDAWDPLRGQIVSRRNVRLIARASASHPQIGTTTVYSTQSIEVRDSRLFNYAIFYNLRMEFHPGAPMSVWGPVHSNEDFHLTTDAQLTFFDVVSSARNIIAQGFNPTRSSNRNISFRSGDPVNGIPPTTSITGHAFGYIDSFLATRPGGESFANRASQLYRGSVQDYSMGVEVQNPPGVTNPTEARSMIEPPDFSAGANPALEEQKFSRKAGIYVLVDNAAANHSTAPRVTVFSSALDANAYKTSADRATWLIANPSRVLTPPNDLINPTRRMRDNREEKNINMIDINMGIMRTALQANAGTPVGQKFLVNGSDWNPNTGWTGAVYVEIENPNRGFTTTSDILRIGPADSSPRPGVGTDIGTATAVRLVNASRLPTLTSAAVDPGVSFVTNAPIYIAGHFNANGTMAAANAAVQNGSERAPDPDWNNGTPNNRNDDLEVPALVAADAINILSSNWVNAAGIPIGDGRFASNGGSVVPRVAVNTEISGVFLSGIVETAGTNNVNYSGGVENYPRFHENWGGGRTVLYRGSIVALFTSRFATGIWGKGNVYDAPTRRWGFHEFFANGDQPPFTPTIRTYRRTDFRDLTATEYNALIGGGFGFTEM